MSVKTVTLVQYASDILEHWEVPHAQLPDLGALSAQTVHSDLVRSLSDIPFNLEELKRLSPETLIADSESIDTEPDRVRVEADLRLVLGSDVKLIALRARTLEGVYSSIERLGNSFDKYTAAREMCNRIKAQLMDWCDSFYERMKNKRVTVLSSVSPLRVAGRWIPDMVKAASCVPQYNAVGAGPKEVTWKDIEQFKPDVIIIAPEGYTLEESLKTLRFLERLPTWEDIPAVKRGEVIFCDGIGLYRPGPSLLLGIAQLISSLAGLESGYITKRDSFYRLRWVELHRHRF